MVYKCQNGFSKFGRDCYYLSVKTATWQDAFFECQNFSKGSKLVILPRPLDDHNFRKFLKYKKNGNFIKLLTEKKHLINN